MLNCQPHIAIHKSSGSSQSNRFPDALKPEFVKIDERKIEDLIVATNRLSSNIHFYGRENENLGNWNSFFEWESTSIFAQIASLDIEKVVFLYKQKKNALRFISSIEAQEKEVKIFISEIQFSVRDLSLKIKKLPEDLPVREYFIATYATIEKLLEGIQAEVETSSDLIHTFQNHLFHKKIQNLFGLLGDWKKKSHKQLYINIDNYSGHSPQYALYLTFLKLFEYAQNEINTFTNRHLDFYYKNILHLNLKAATPDYVHCLVEPHKDEEPFLIEKDSIFLGGKDSDGKKKYYASTADTVVNQAKIESIFSGYRKNNNYYFEELTAHNASGRNWSAFPGTSAAKEIGIALASPLFFLRGGERTITLTFNEYPVTYQFFFSGEKGWIEVIPLSPQAGKNECRLFLSANEEAVVPFKNKTHEGVPIKTDFPVLKIVSEEGGLGANLEVKGIIVKVENYQQFKLFSDAGEIDHTKSFQPFGAMPRTGRSMVFSCNEFFQKQNAEGNIEIEANLKIEGNLETEDDALAISLNYLNEGVWEEISEEKCEGLGDEKNGICMKSQHSPIAPDFEENKPLTPGATSGFARITLTDSSYTGEAYLEKYIEHAKDTTSELLDIPTCNGIRFSYSVSSNLEVNDEPNKIDCFHLYPKGYKKISGTNVETLPTMNSGGELFIGLRDVNAGNAVNLLFQVAEGTANPRQLPAELGWCYLEKDTWKIFDPVDLVDQSNGLTQSGIVHLKLPDTLNISSQIILPSDLFWIKIQVKERVDAICDLVGIHTQALKAVLHDHDKNGLTYIEKTESETITRLLAPKPQVKKIVQPYPSFGGVREESDSLFYQRVSERLRHKERAITSWDYEKLILEKFPDVFRVKCLNHFRYDEEVNNTSSGYVTIIPVAKGPVSNVPEYWKPLVDIGTMKRIKSFLLARSSPHVRLNVKQPSLEKIELEFKVKYRDIPGGDSQLYKKQLEEAINRFLSPWAYQDNEIHFQKEMEKSTLIHLIESLTFVDYLQDFKVNQLIINEDENKRSDVDKIVPRTVYSLFVPATHKICPI